MTDVVEQQTAAVETVEKKEEEAAPALPTTEPPKDEEVKAAAEAAPAPEAAVEEKKEEKKEEKVEEPPKDPREDPVGWLGQQIPQAVHIVNHQVLDWAQKFAIEDEAKRAPLPGKNGAVTRNQFLNFLKDGTLLASLAKKCGANVETIHEGDAVKNNKENQTANIQAFADWAKENLGLPEDKVVSVADVLEKGKAGYPQVFEAVWATGSQAVEKFGATTGIDVDSVVAAASQAVKSNIVQKILNFFKSARPSPQLEKKAALEAEEAEKKEKAAAAEKLEEVVEEECKKTESVPAPAVVEAN
ncbi:chdp-1 [Pristionchus pacificus]|uniref:Chdp-1 n=1 Tax=Pristionchus pacificus TaxID=54126 RepID=A0A2A6BUD5_PRIPA|nr:chdp-1 [Pristionchus pacificus]|eukprot:PDM69515.1 chdp-1 [Pristionchus pacificus]